MFIYPFQNHKIHQLHNVSLLQENTNNTSARFFSRCRSQLICYKFLSSDLSALNPKLSNLH